MLPAAASRASASFWRTSKQHRNRGHFRADLIGIRDAHVGEFGRSSDSLVGLEQTLRRLVELGGRSPSEDLPLERAELGTEFELGGIDLGPGVDDLVDDQPLAELIGVEVFDVLPGQPELRGVLGERPLVDAEEGGLVGLAEEGRAEAALHPVDPLFERAGQLLGQFLADRGPGSREPGPDEIIRDCDGTLQVGDDVRGRRGRPGTVGGEGVAAAVEVGAAGWAAVVVV